MNKYTKIYLTSAVVYGTIIGVSYSITPGNSYCTEQTKINQQKDTREMPSYGQIDITALKNMIETKIKMSILDARTQKWDDGRRIPGAISLPADSAPAVINQSLPDKDALLVVYCGSYQCPLGKKLAETLVNQGYKHVLEYAGGMNEWAGTFHNPVINEKM